MIFHTTDDDGLIEFALGTRKIHGAQSSVGQ